MDLCTAALCLLALATCSGALPRCGPRCPLVACAPADSRIVDGCGCSHCISVMMPNDDSDALPPIHPTVSRLDLRVLLDSELGKSPYELDVGSALKVLRFMTSFPQNKTATN